MKLLSKLKADYCSLCDFTNECKKNKAKCYKYSKRLLNKKIRQKSKKLEVKEYEL